MCYRSQGKEQFFKKSGPVARWRKLKTGNELDRSLVRLRGGVVWEPLRRKFKVGEKNGWS